MHTKFDRVKQYYLGVMRTRTLKFVTLYSPLECKKVDAKQLYRLHCGILQRWFKR